MRRAATVLRSGLGRDGRRERVEWAIPQRSERLPLPSRQTGRAVGPHLSITVSSRDQRGWKRPDTPSTAVVPGYERSSRPSWSAAFTKGKLLPALMYPNRVAGLFRPW
jgi:hypothetical protein